MDERGPSLVESVGRPFVPPLQLRLRLPRCSALRGASSRRPSLRGRRAPQRWTRSWSGRSASATARTRPLSCGGRCVHRPARAALSAEIFGILTERARVGSVLRGGHHRRWATWNASRRAREAGGCAWTTISSPRTGTARGQTRLSTSQPDPHAHPACPRTRGVQPGRDQVLRSAGRGGRAAQPVRGMKLKTGACSGANADSFRNAHPSPISQDGDPPRQRHCEHPPDAPGMAPHRLPSPGRH